MSEISPSELAERLHGKESPYVLDIRHEEDYASWHIPQSENIDVYDELQSDAETAAEALQTIPDNEEVVTVCAAGVIADRATEVLRELGYEAKTLTDGMNGWSQVHRSAALGLDIAGTLLQVARPGKGCLSYVLVSDGNAAVFDPSHVHEQYEALVQEHDAEIVGVFDTHAHADHISGGRTLAARHDVPYYLHPADALSTEATPIADGELYEIGSVEVAVMHTPGHSPGGVTYEIGGEALLTGDTLFHETIGRIELGVEAGIEETDVSSNAETLYESLQRLVEYPGDPVVLPAHDSGSPEPPVMATLSDVKARNEDLSRDREAFVETLASDLPEHPPNFQRVKKVNVGEEDIDVDELSELELGPNRCAAE